MKWILRIAVVLVLLVVVTLGAGYFFLNQIVQRVVVDAGSQATGTQTSLAGVGLSPFSGSANLSGFGVGNPDAFGAGDVFGFSEADVQVDPASLLSDTIVVPRFHIRGATVKLVYADGKLNVMELLERLQGEADPDTGTPEPEEPADGAAAKKVVINDLQVLGTRLQGSIELPGLSTPAEIDLVIPDVVMTNIGSDGSGVTAKEAMRLVLEAVFANARKEAINADVLEDQLKELLAGQLGDAKARFDEAKANTEATLDAQKQRLEDAKANAEATLESGEQAVEEGRQKIEGIKQGLGGLFGGKKDEPAAE